VIVPALVLFSGMPIHRAVGTSLMVIAMVSVSGIASQLGAGRSLSLEVTGLFVAGGIAGLFTGQQIGRRLSGPVLQKVFVVAILAVAVYVIVRNLQQVSHFQSGMPHKPEARAKDTAELPSLALLRIGIPQRRDNFQSGIPYKPEARAKDTAELPAHC
jgi:hypothetical protein